MSLLRRNLLLMSLLVSVSCSKEAEPSSAQGEVTKAETAKAETAEAQTAKAETAKAETAKAETAEAQTAEAQTAKGETAPAPVDLGLDPDSPDAITMLVAPFEVGMMYSVVDTNSTSIEIPRESGPATAFKGRRKEVKLVEILAVKSGLPSKIKASYREFSEVLGADGKEQVTGDSIANKAYIVERVGGDLVLSDEAGKDVSEAEAALLVGDHKKLGEPDTWHRAVAGKTFKVGERIAVPELALLWADLGTPQRDPNFGITYKGLRDSIAVFAVEGIASVDDGSTVTAFVVTGTVEIDPVTSRRRGKQLKIEMTFSGARTGTGTTRGTKSWSYL